MKYVFMNNKDKLIKDYINKHYQELLDCLKEINDNFDNFLNDQIIQKAISFDLFQIGELFNNLSNDFASKLNKRDVRGIIDIRKMARSHLLLMVQGR